MTPEQRLDRLERLAKLFVKAGRRARREMNEKINIILDAQIKNEERFAQLAESHKHLAESQTHSDRRLDALIDVIRKEREGNSGKA